MKYIAKPVVIEALLFTNLEDNLHDICKFIGDDSYIYGCDGLFIRTLEGNMHVSVGDYVIKGTKGEYYPCKPDVFENKYEEVK